MTTRLLEIMMLPALHTTILPGERFEGHQGLEISDHFQTVTTFRGVVGPYEVDLRQPNSADLEVGRPRCPQPTPRDLEQTAFSASGP
jgi:hypothetical protein